MLNKDAMPQAKLDRPHTEIRWELSPQARQQWAPNLMAAAQTDNTISIFDVIGQDPWTGEGVTAKRIAAALRAIGADKDVVVNINSPGGDLFEGLAIYSLLREHNGKVTVKVLGVAASAASIVAMAGNEIMIARAGFLMIHDTWVLVIGNRNDLRDVADQLEPFDAAMADIYSARSGVDVRAVQKMMDAETWINGSAAVDQGFADSLLPSDQVREDKSARTDRVAAHTLDKLLAKCGMTRTERRALMHEFKSGTPGAAGQDTGTPSATEGTPSAAEASEFVNTLSNFSLSEQT
jgi:ATP-dependent protease ClpP protease subunit